MATPRRASRREAGQSPGRRRKSQPSGSSRGVILAGAAGITAVVVSVIMMSSDSSEPIQGDPIVEAPLVKEEGSSNAGRSATRNASRPKTAPVYTGSVNREPWSRITTYMAETLRLQKMAESLRSKKDEDGFKREIRKALEEYRALQLVFYEWQDEVEALQEGLFDRRFKSEDRKIARLNKTMRRYFQFEK